MSTWKFVAACLALACLRAEAQTTNDFIIPEQKVSGRVCDAGTGLPLKGVIVRLVSSIQTKEPRSTTTTADGHYDLSVPAFFGLRHRLEFSKTGWSPYPHLVVADLSKGALPDVLLADIKGSDGYYRTLADATVKSGGLLTAAAPPQLESVLSLPPEQKAATLGAIQTLSKSVYGDVLAADKNYGTIKELRERLATTSGDVTAEFAWKKPSAVAITGTVKSEAEKSKILGQLNTPTGKTLFTDELKVNRFDNRMANQPKIAPSQMNLTRPLEGKV